MNTHHTKTARLAKDVMTPEPVCVEPSTSIRELAEVFETNEVSGVPVIDEEGKVIGVVSKTDLIRRCSEGLGDRPPAYLFEVKKPAESKAPYDYYKVRATIPADQAFRPMADGECPLVKK